MATKTNIYEFHLPVDMTTFLNLYWLDGDNHYYHTFLKEKLKNLDISISDWYDNTRKIRSLHPSKVSFPGLPSHAESTKIQTIHSHNSEIRITEQNTFQGIPYADFFSVKIEWVVQNLHLSGEKDAQINIKIYLDIVFHKYTWLESTIFANTKSELVEVYTLWHHYAMEYLSNHSPPEVVYAVKSHPSSASLVSEEDEVFYDCEDIEYGGYTPKVIKPQEEHRYSTQIAICVETVFVICEFYIRQVRLLSCSHSIR